MAQHTRSGDWVAKAERTHELSRERRYRVAGIDEDGDVQAFESDSLERARDVEEQMREDLNEVTFDKRAG